MKNSIHYSKQNTAKAIRVIAALAPLGQQTSHSLQSLCFAPCNVIYYFIAPLLKIRFSVPVKRDETVIFNPRGETLKVGLQTALLSRFTGTKNQILKTVAMKNSMHYSKQNTANATRVTAALASLGQQTLHLFAIAVFRPL